MFIYYRADYIEKPNFYPKQDLFLDHQNNNFLIMLHTNNDNAIRNINFIRAFHIFKSLVISILDWF